jgi:hypothetical protein
MKAAERTKQYLVHMDVARKHYDAAHSFLSRGTPGYVAAAIHRKNLMYYELFKAAEVNWTSNSPKQQQQRKLASQLWRISGIKGVAGNLMFDLRDGRIATVHKLLHEIEQQLRHQMRNIK